MNKKIKKKKIKESKNKKNVKNKSKANKTRNKTANKTAKKTVKGTSDNYYEIKETNDSNKISKSKIVLMTITIVLIIAYMSFSIYTIMKNPAETFVVNNGTLSEDETVYGYIVREETVVQNEKQTNNIVKIKQEGEKVGKGNSIYRYYSENEKELLEKINNLNTQIQEAMESNANIFSTDKKLLETQIEEEIDNVYKNNKLETINESKQIIESYITKKAKIVGELSPSGSYIKGLIEEKTSYEKQIQSEGDYVVAPISGIVSYRIDGLEEVLTPEDFSKFDKKFISDLNLKTGQTIVSNQNKAKIINNYNCYIVFNSNSEESKNVEIKDNIKIKIQNEAEINAVVQNIIEEKDKSRTITIKIQKEVEDLIAYRKISLDIIWWSAKGYRIPNSAIQQIDNIAYVYRNRNGYTNKMAVKILKQNENYSIVEAYTRNELLELGLTSDEISNLKTITLYDEILLNPTE